MLTDTAKILLILTIPWSVIGQFPPSPPGGYYLQAQAKITVPKPAPPPAGVHGCIIILVCKSVE